MRFVAIMAAFTPIAVLAAALAGCSGVDETDGSRRGTSALVPVSDRPAEGDADPANSLVGEPGRIPQYPHRAGSASPDARFSGNVEIDGSCIYLKGGTERVLPIFPEGSVSWIKAGESFRFAGSDYKAGSELVVGGGEARSPGGEARRFAISPAQTCDGTVLWYVVPA